MKRYIAPLVAIGLTLAVLAFAVLNIPQSKSGIFDSSAASYFIKPIELNHSFVVEPNLEGYMNDKIDAPDLEEVLYSSLDELRSRYVIDRTEIVETERKGRIFPTLFVYVHPNQDLQQPTDAAQAGKA
ncbi:hypothetical protein IFO70_05465 [Phormidium tenue FACHB-886]|nr:hypothetical protein [Phormidium tenue FACHB-886]